MTPRKPCHTLKSFRELISVLDLTSLPLDHRFKHQVPEEKLTSESEEELFQKEMEGVKPVLGKRRIGKIAKAELAEGFREKDDAETLKRLEALVHHGTGFNVADTPEYIEGTGYHVHPEIAKRLHRGDFSIQAHLDLHGFIAEDAKEVFDQFMKWVVIHGKTGILVTHGRGLSSPAEPVLKRKVEEWLTRGSWRKWVVAYSSARKCDGGAGATYVLLRKHPVSKRFKIRRTSGGKP
ncbi:MAG: Smr/MutS family protein [Thermodesulfobacteriota bacterium]|nr:Smr/MutS family protein [Thermodesulfobacteriota bacterium]